jgi:hypothetical protein
MLDGGEAYKSRLVFFCVWDVVFFGVGLGVILTVAKWMAVCCCSFSVL